MDIDKIRRRRAIKVVITDIFMSIIVISIVFVLVAVVSGWRINADFKVEQNGLVSFQSSPNGARIFIDDNETALTTKTSKMLPGGEHKIVLQKPGYESWEKEVIVKPGWLLRLEYPRLFKQDREKTTIKSFDNLKFFYASPTRDSAFFAEDNTANWSYIFKLNESPEIDSIDVEKLFSGVENGIFNLVIKSVEWSHNGNRVLINATNENYNDWVLLDLKTPTNSVNLSRSLNTYKTNSKSILKASQKSTAMNITSAHFETESGDKIIALSGGKIVYINVVERVASEDIAKDVESFYQKDGEIVYLTNSNDRRMLMLKRLGDNKAITISEIGKNQKTTFALTRFNSSVYLSYTIDNTLYVRKAHEFPDENAKITAMRLILKAGTSIIPSEVKVSRNGEYIVFREGTKLNVFDAELEDWNEYDSQDEKIRFLDDHILYRVDDSIGKFLAWDFDGTNVRTLVVDKAINDYDAMISIDNKFFFYIAKAETGFDLIQEKL